MAINEMVFTHDIKTVVQMSMKEYRDYVTWLGKVIPDVQSKSCDVCNLWQMSMPAQTIEAHPITAMSRVVHPGKRAGCGLCGQLV